MNSMLNRFLWKYKSFPITISLICLCILVYAMSFVKLKETIFQHCSWNIIQYNNDLLDDNSDTLSKFLLFYQLCEVYLLLPSYLLNLL